MVGVKREKAKANTVISSDFFKMNLDRKKTRKADRYTNISLVIFKAKSNPLDSPASIPSEAKITRK